MKNPDDDDYADHISHLTIRENPPIPSNERLIELYLTGYDGSHLGGGFVSALQAIWRDGCDAGMVAP